jgi:hypothetical protein
MQNLRLALFHLLMLVFAASAVGKSLPNPGIFALYGATNGSLSGS